MEIAVDGDNKLAIIQIMNKWVFYCTEETFICSFIRQRCSKFKNEGN